jgi:hypothetical protein
VSKTIPVAPEEPEILLRLEALRRDLDSRARRAVWRAIGGRAASFLLGAAIGHWWH